ncbi:nucleotidyltransferase family protein [Streptomyces sp. ME19-01-6]|uniref:nucleotidyltransferase family protein n=1 Tax=Streptomyces sp. ME19-01-6 TaxID=3028686 RepID=UPI0029AA3F35|nr:nucleotidyltransferase family protein [Streptomyces sp. ME19-01-6]MDX3225241.1 nucleotidyltransferase family protein [Streptomyces sp. ME19-01-6]
MDIDLLIALSDPWMCRDGAEQLRKVLLKRRGDIDWDWITNQAVRHRTLPLIGFNVKKFRLYRSVSGDVELIPNHWVLTCVFEGNRRRNEELGAEFGRILTALNEAGITYAIRKGPLLCERLFPDPGARRTNDFDLLVTPSGAREVSTVLLEQGYKQGLLAVDGEVRSYQRSTQAFWGLHINNALPFIKATSVPGVEAFLVDLCLSVLPERERRAAGSEDFLARAVPTVSCGVDAFALSPADELLDLCQHLYKEADSSFYIAAGRDIALSKFIDVASAVRLADQDTLATFVERARHYEMVRNVYYAIAHTAKFYPDVVPAWLVEELRPEGDLSYLDEYGHMEGSVHSWRSGMVERAFGPDRSSVVEGGGGIPVT